MTPPPKIEALTPGNPQDPWPHLQKMTHTHTLHLATLKIHDPTSKIETLTLNTLKINDPTSKNWSLDT